MLLLGTSVLVFPVMTERVLKRLPRSRLAAGVFFGAALIWFLIEIRGLSPADFGDERVPLFWGFGLVGLLAFRYAPDFLALRGLSALMLLVASPLLRASFMKYDVPGIYFQTGLVYFGITLALILAGQPWRWRDAVEWFFEKRLRVRNLGVVFLVYGVLLSFVAEMAWRQNM
jgi:hypothetical protein